MYINLNDTEFDEELRFTDEEEKESWSMNIEEIGPYLGLGIDPEDVS